MATFLQWTLPMPIVASPGAQVSLSAILTQSFGSLPGAWAGGWIAYYGAAQLLAWNFQYWNLNSPSAGTWLYNGLDIGASTASTFNQTYVPVGSFGSASFRAGNDMGPLAYLTVPESGTAGSYTSYIQYSLITVDPNLMSATAGLGAPTAADIVAAAYRFNSYYGFVANNNDCHYIASDIAASAGATFPDMTGSLTPSQNEEGGFWRIVYRGSDPNPISNWQTLVKPGDIVRMGWIGGGQHTTTVLAVNPNGSIVVYDNGYYLNNVEGVGVHTVNYDQLTIAADTTIYRLTTDGLYLENDSLSVTNDAIPGTIFNDRILGGSGNDTIGGGAGDDTISSGAGNDIISGGLGTNTVLGGAGWNTASYNVAFAAATIVRNADGSVKISGSGFADTLTDIEIARFTDRTVSLRLRAASDFTSSDNSGVLFRNVATGDTGFYHLNADGSLQGWRSVGASATAYAIVGTGDFTGVGHADVLFRNNSTGDTGFYKLDSNGALQGWVHIGASSTAYSVTGVGDFNADGLADILYRNNATGDTGFYQLNSDGSFNSWHSLGASSTAYAIAGVGDFNGDGVSDVLFQNKATGDTGFYQLNSDGSLNSWHGVAMASTAYTLVGTGDFNRDGVSDVLFRDNTGGDIGFFQMNPGGTVQGWRDIGASSAAWSVAAVGDYNGDGASDILFRNGSTGDLGFYQLNADGSYQGWHGLGASSTAYSVIA